MLSSLSISSSADLPELKCSAWTWQHEEKRFVRAELKRAPYDSQYFEAQIQNFGFGVDQSFLPSEGVGFIIYDKLSHRSTLSTVGFRRIGISKFRQADLTYYDRLPDGGDIQAGVECTYLEP